MRLRSTLILTAALAVLGCNPRTEPDAGRDSGDPGIDSGPCTPSGAENTAAACMDMIDNDCNGFRDCNDFACCSARTCGPDTTCGRRDGGGECTPTGAEDSMAACTDGVDNDCDNFRDCRDFDCADFCGVENSNPTCVDGLDNDDDGFTDCMDRDCEMRIVCAGEASNANCSDGIDNDGMGGTDCADVNCQDEAIVVCNGTTPVTVDPDDYAAQVQAACTNGTDDDGDGRIDCGEFSCLWNYPDCVAPPTERYNAACANGEDDDLDGLTDCDDPGCQAEGTVVCNGATPVAVEPSMYTTLANTQCSDTLDNDMPPNGFSDCMDFGCTQNPDVTVDCPGENTDARCSDMMDNDSNGFTDCADFSCTRNPRVTVCEVESGVEECSNGIDDDGNGFADCADFSCAPATGTRSPACR